MQECMAVDADELRRDVRRLEAFHSSLNQLARGVEASGTKVQQSLQAGFDSMQAVLVQRAGALLAQAADVTAERLAMVRAQGDRTTVVVKEAKAVVAIAERVGIACVMSSGRKTDGEESCLRRASRS